VSQAAPFRGPRGVLGRLRGIAGREAFPGLGLTGEYDSWNAALEASTGYDDAVILEKTRLAALQAKNGEAAFERDSVAFGQAEYAWPLLAAVLWVAAKNGGRLSVLDFGGSLGSTYYQHRTFLEGLERLRWSVVEQPAHVEVGRRDFQDEVLRFHYTIEKAVAESAPDVVVLSSVLQYLERPHEVLGRLLGLECDHLVIDRTTVWTGSEDRLYVQDVPAAIYDASYPCWVFSEAVLFAQMKTAGFRVVAGLGTEELSDGALRYRECGALLERRATPA
jgi:putative methyltransferase (TIGR04325 family)